MCYSLETIKQDISNLAAEDFYEKYYLCPENWYFENILGIEPGGIPEFENHFKSIICDELNLSVRDVIVVGSSKTGYSLKPTKGQLYKAFNDDESVRKVSDIDVAIVSEELFKKYWDLFRKCYKFTYKRLYDTKIHREVFYGHINGWHIREVRGCRREWLDFTKSCNNKLTSSLYIRHDVNYRLYRNKDDLRGYHISGINKIKGGYLDGH